MGNVWVLIPEDDTVPGLLVAAEELLATLTFANDPETNPDASTDPWVLPAPIADEVALAALGRIALEIRDALPAPEDWDHPQQQRPRLLAPDGHHELVPARPLWLNPADVAVFAETVRVCRQALDPAARETSGFGRAALLDLAELLDQIEQGTTHDPVPDGVDPRTAALAPLTRLSALITHDHDAADYQALVDTLVDTNDDVVLDERQARAYRRLADRWNHVLADGDLLQRWLYQ